MIREKETFQQALLEWYDGSARILPWREDPQPYRVWVSEIMLQQTRVETVTPYFQRFMAALPTISALAEAEEELILKLWQGLGYYNRVKNMQRAACQVMEHHGGQLPRTKKELETLPGIGDYTSGAIASIAFHQKETAVDGNVLRVFSRLRTYARDITTALAKKELAKEVYDCLPEKRPGDFNQSLMELGARVCLPHGAPLCEECPVSSFCEARKTGRMMEFPIKAPKKKRIPENKTVFILQKGEKVALSKRPSKGLLSGLWEFPNAPGYLDQEEALALVRQWGYSPEKIRELPESKMIFSHREWHMKAWWVTVEEQNAEQKVMEPEVLRAEKREKSEEAVQAAGNWPTSVMEPWADYGQEKKNPERKIIFRDTSFPEDSQRGPKQDAQKPPKILWAAGEEVDAVYSIPSAFKTYLQIVSGRIIES